MAVCSPSPSSRAESARFLVQRWSGVKTRRFCCFTPATMRTEPAACCVLSLPSSSGLAGPGRHLRGRVHIRRDDGASSGEVVCLPAVLRPGHSSSHTHAQRWVSACARKGSRPWFQFRCRRFPHLTGRRVMVSPIDFRSRRRDLPPSDLTSSTAPVPPCPSLAQLPSFPIRTTHRDRQHGCHEAANLAWQWRRQAAGGGHHHDGVHWQSLR